MSGLLKAADIASSAHSGASGILQKMKSAARGQPMDEEQSMLGQIDSAVTLTLKQRLIGFGICVGLGILFSLLSIPMLWIMKYASFAILYSLGSIVSIGSTMFLMGPVNQVKKMFEQHRILATITYFLMIILTLVVAFKTGSAPLCLLFIVLQFLALAWCVCLVRT